MPNVIAVYVAASEGGQRNLEAGLDNLVWGWRDSVLDRKNHRNVAAQIRPGDLLIMGSHGPNPRVPEGGWAQARLGRVLLLRITSALYQAQTRVWPDEANGVLYPNRVDFEVVYDARPPEVVALEPEALEALRWSANTQGSPVQVILPGGAAPRFAVDGGANANAGRLNHDGAFDALAQVLVRREQRKIRDQKFGNRADLMCELCGKTYPARLVRAAHIKRRSACTPDELLDLNNIMAACALGCDEMFEHGFVAIDDSGSVVPGKTASGDLAAAVAGISGKQCRAYGAASTDFFAWHRADHAQPA